MKGSSLRMNGTLNTKKVNLGQDHAAEPGTTATPGTGQTAEGTALGVHRPFSERYPSRDCYRLLSRSIRCGSSSYYNMHYHQDNLNTLHINNFDTEHVSIDCTLKWIQHKMVRQSSLLSLISKQICQKSYPETR